jgi:hypothetical protein
MIDRRAYKGTSIFLVFQQLINSELKQYEEFINEVSTDLLYKQRNLERDYEKASKEIEQEDEDPHQFFEDDIHKYFKVFPVYTYSPMLLSLYGQLENWLKKLCELDSRKGFSKVQVNDLAGNNYIEKSRRYLTLVSEIDLSDVEADWRRIIEIQKIRNLIAHNNSNIVKNRSVSIEKHELYNVLSNDNRIEFDRGKGSFYIKDKEFLFDVIAVIGKYLAAVIDKLKMRQVFAKNTSMPCDNADWGLEKSEDMLTSIISIFDLLDRNDQIGNGIKEPGVTSNIKGSLVDLTYQATKIYSFFCNGNWGPSDRDLIVKERREGLAKLKKIYRG